MDSLPSDTAVVSLIPELHYMVLVYSHLTTRQARHLQHSHQRCFLLHVHDLHLALQRRVVRQILAHF